MVKNQGTTTETSSISRVNKYKIIHRIVIPPVIMRSSLSKKGIENIPSINIPIPTATKIPIKLEKSTKPPEPRLPTEYFSTKYWSVILVKAHKNGAPRAIKNHCIDFDYTLILLNQLIWYTF